MHLNTFNMKDMVHSINPYMNFYFQQHKNYLDLSTKWLSCLEKMAKTYRATRNNSHKSENAWQECIDSSQEFVRAYSAIMSGQTDVPTDFHGTSRLREETDCVNYGKIG